MAENPEYLPAELVLVDDDADDRFMIERALRRVRPQLRIVALGDGIELIDYLRRCSPHALPRLVLLDLNLPRMDGREVLGLLKADHCLRDIPVFVLTTSVEPEDRARVFALQATGFISKPDGYAELMRILRNLLDSCLGHDQAMEI